MWEIEKGVRVKKREGEKERKEWSRGTERKRDKQNTKEDVYGMCARAWYHMMAIKKKKIERRKRDPWKKDVGVTYISFLLE